MTSLAAWDVKALGCINVIGCAGERLFARYIIGTAGNAAPMAFSRSVGSQAPDFGVRVVAVNPGYTATDRAESVLRPPCDPWQRISVGYR